MQRVKGLAFRVEGLWFRVNGLGFIRLRVFCLGLRVRCRFYGRWIEKHHFDKRSFENIYAVAL